MNIILYITIGILIVMFFKWKGLLIEKLCNHVLKQFDELDAILSDKDLPDINNEIEKIQSSIKELQNLIKRHYDGKFSDGNAIITEAALKNADTVYENLEQIKALCDVLSDAYDDMIGSSS